MVSVDHDDGFNPSISHDVWVLASDLHRERCRNTMSPCPRRGEHLEDAADLLAAYAALTDPAPSLPWDEVKRQLGLPDHGSEKDNRGTAGD